MRRIGTTLLVATVPLVLVVAARAARVTALPVWQAPRPTSASTPVTPTSVKGTVTCHDLVALLDDARLTVQLVEVSRFDGTEVVLLEQAIAPSGRSCPFEFELGYSPASIESNGEYMVGANIVAGGKLVYWTATRLGVITQGNPTTVELALTQAGPSTYANMALSSGRLARQGY